MFNRLKLSTPLDSSPDEEELKAKGWEKIHYSRTRANSTPFESPGKSSVTWRS